MAVQNLILALTAGYKTLSRASASPACYKAGFIQFAYATGRGALQPINWTANIFFPERSGATGAVIYADDAVSWLANLVMEPTDGVSVVTTADVLNLAIAETLGLTPGNTVSTGSDTTGSANVLKLPGRNGAGQLVQINGKQAFSLQQVTIPSKTLIPWTAAIAYASEIAQQQVMANASETTETFPVTAGGTLLTPTSAVPRNATVQSSVLTATPATSWGARGIPMLGKWAWDYNGYKTPAENINALTFFTAPPYPGCTAGYIILKQRVIANVILGENTFDILAVQNALGTVNMLANDLSGLGL